MAETTLSESRPLTLESGRVVRFSEDNSALEELVDGNWTEASREALVEWIADGDTAWD